MATAKKAAKKSASKSATKDVSTANKPQPVNQSAAKDTEHGKAFANKEAARAAKAAAVKAAQPIDKSVNPEGSWPFPIDDRT